MISDWLDDETLRWFLLPGLAALALAMFGWWRDRKRRNRSDPDAVGVIDWTTLSFWASLLACLLLAGALRTWIKG